MRTFVLALLASSAALVGTGAQAAQIIGLYNSGVVSGGANSGAGGGATTGNGIDPHCGLANGTTYNGGVNGVFPIGPWLSETSSYRWLTPTANAADDVGSPYTFTLTFDLTGFNASTARFAGRAAADNAGELFLNGNSIGPIGGLDSFTDFATASGFRSGVNLIEFRVDNFAGPAGGLIEFTSSDVTAAGAVPEPATWAMTIGGVGMAGGALRRRRRAATLALA